MKKAFLRGSIAALALTAATQASAGQVYITEWMYKGVAEFVELTNLSGADVDFTGWSYDDDSENPGVFDLSGFGIVAHGESVVFTEAPTGADFRGLWNLDASVKVLGGVENNIGSNDQINIYDASNNLVDSLTYGDSDFPGTIKTSGTSGRPDTSAALGADDVYQWVFSTVGDVDGGFLSPGGDIGSPGSYTPSPVPLPAAAWLMISGLIGLGATRRRRSV